MRGQVARRVRGVPRGAAFAATLALAVVLGRATRSEDAQIALVWPAAAVTTVWLATSWGRRRAVARDAALIAVVIGLVNLATGASPGLAAGFALANVLHAVVACAVLRRERPGRWALTCLADLRALATAAAAASAVSAAVGTAALTSLEDAPVTFGGLLCRNAVSTLLLCSLALRLCAHDRRPAPTRHRELVLIVTAATAAYAVSIAVGMAFALVLAVLPLAVWAALRLPTTTAVALSVANGVGVSVVAVLAAVPLVAGGPATRVLISQVFLAVTGGLVLVLALHRDERSALIARLGESEQRFRLAFASAPTGLCEVSVEPGAEGEVLAANPAMAALLRLTADELTGRSLLDGSPDRALLLADLVRAARAGELDPVERRLRRADGRLVWVSCAGAVVRPAGDEPYLMLLVTDVTDRRRADQVLRHQAQHDALTGLPNRMLLVERLAEAVDGGDAGVLYLDLDGFKAVNDRAGHSVGDLLLQQVSDRLVAAVRPGDTVGRLGGDEFAVVCPGVSPAQLTAVASRLVDAVSRPYDVHGHLLSVTTSVGSCLSDGRSGAAELLRRADTAMYVAKGEGKDRVCAAPAVVPPQHRRRVADA